MYYFYGKINRGGGGMLTVHCMEAVRISESPLWEVPLYIQWACYDKPQFHSLDSHQQRLSYVTSLHLLASSVQSYPLSL